MKIKQSLILILMSMFFMLGCEKLTIDMKTNINPNGSGVRITLYQAEGEKIKEELKSKYILPDGGVWTEEELKPNKRPNVDDKWFKSTKVSIYTLKRKFKNINELSPDYTRIGIHPDNISRNKIEVTIQKHFFYDIYNYKEVFNDVAEEGKVRNLVEEEYNNSLDALCKRIKEKFLIKDETELKNILQGKYRPLFDKTLDNFLKQGLNEAEDIDWGSLKTELINLLIDYIIKDSRELTIDRNELEDQLKEVLNNLEKEFQDHFVELANKNFNDILGVYGYPLFIEYKFLSSVSLPGIIIETNSKKVNNNTASWEFSNQDFFLKDYSTFIKTKKINYVNFILSVFILIFIVYSIFLASKKIKKKAK